MINKRYITIIIYILTALIFIGCGDQSVDNDIPPDFSETPTISDDSEILQISHEADIEDELDENIMEGSNDAEIYIMSEDINDTLETMFPITVMEAY